MFISFLEIPSSSRTDVSLSPYVTFRGTREGGLCVHQDKDNPSQGGVHNLLHSVALEASENGDHGPPV